VICDEKFMEISKMLKDDGIQSLNFKKEKLFKKASIYPANREIL